MPCATLNQLLTNWALNLEAEWHRYLHNYFYNSTIRDNLLDNFEYDCTTLMESAVEKNYSKRSHGVCH